MRLLHKDLTYAVRGCIFDVYNELGTGFDEETYHLAMENRLTQSRIPFKSKVVKYLEHREVKVHKFIADLIIDDKVITELKNITTDFIPTNYLQIISYLKCWQKDLGLLANFGSLSANIERIPFSEKKLFVEENYDEIEDYILASYQDSFEVVREVILNIYKMHGLNYDFTIYQKLFKAELIYQNVNFNPSLLVSIPYKGKIIRELELKIPVINDQILCGITAGQSDLKLPISKMRNYLKKTGLSVGILTNFGKERLEIIGIRI